MGGKWYSIIVLILTSLVIGELGHLSFLWRVMAYSSPGNYLFIVFLLIILGCWAFLIDLQQFFIFELEIFGCSYALQNYLPVCSFSVNFLRLHFTYINFKFWESWKYFYYLHYDIWDLGWEGLISYTKAHNVIFIYFFLMCVLIVSFHLLNSLSFFYWFLMPPLASVKFQWVPGYLGLTILFP